MFIRDAIQLGSSACGPCLQYPQYGHLGQFRPYPLSSGIMHLRMLRGICTVSVQILLSGTVARQTETRPNVPTPKTTHETSIVVQHLRTSIFWQTSKDGSRYRMEKIHHNPGLYAICLHHPPAVRKTYCCAARTRKLGAKVHR